MDSQAIRITIAAVAVALVIAVLSILVVESRSVTNEYFISHAERMRAVEFSATDIETVRSGVDVAFKAGASVSAAVELALVRLGENRNLLQDFSDAPRMGTDLSSRLDAYAGAAQTFVDAARTFTTQQEELAGELGALQEESASLVKHLRDQGLTGEAQQTFVLAIDALESATGQNDIGSDALRQRIDVLVDRPYPPETAERVERFADRATGPLATRVAAEAALDPVLSSDIDTELSALWRDLVVTNTEAVSRAERARLLLAVCASILLIAAAYAVVRLQFSYRELNRANVRLEERVRERTEQLSNAYTELKESQVQLIHAEKMSSLGEMVAGISHEINTPLWYLMNNSSVVQERLNVVGQLCDVAESMLGGVRARRDINQIVGRGLVEMNELMKDGIKDDIEEAKDLIKDSIDGLNDLTALAQGLKDFSRLDRAQKGDFNVNEGLERTFLIAKNKLKNKATIHKHYGDIPHVHCSPSQINQVFLNLLTNAADAIPEHGEIIVHTSESNGVVEISISDSGTGIPEENLNRIRNPFFTTKDVGKGTGLGLSIVDRIVTEHRGELRIESEVGRGTTVTVALPVGETVPQEAQPESELEIDPGVLHRQQTGGSQHIGGSLSA